MHSGSTAFRNDVLTAERAVLAVDPQGIVFKLANAAPGPRDWPHATRDNIERTLKKVASLARPQDKVIVLLTTHGTVGALAIGFDDGDQSLLDARALRGMLAGLDGKPTLLVLSACFSGSLLRPLAAPNRVILTAAAADRASFGCQSLSTNTYFVDALFNQPSLADRSIVQLMDVARRTIAARERAEDLSPPSSPQMFVGRAVRRWAGRPLGAGREGG